MSDRWAPYIQSIINGAAGECDKAAILGKDNGSDWVSPGEQVLTFQDKERTIMTSLFKSSSHGIEATGIFLGGHKYIFIKYVNDMVVFKKGNTGAIIGASEQAIIVATVKADGHVPSVVKSVEAVIQYLKDNNL